MQALSRLRGQSAFSVAAEETIVGSGPAAYMMLRATSVADLHQTAMLDPTGALHRRHLGRNLQPGSADKALAVKSRGTPKCMSRGLHACSVAAAPCSRCLTFCLAAWAGPEVRGRLA